MKIPRVNVEKVQQAWWRTGLFWSWPWEYVDGPVFYSIGLGLWSVWWSAERISYIDGEGRIRDHRYFKIELNRD